MHKYNNYFSYFLVSKVDWHSNCWGPNHSPVWIFSLWFPIIPTTHLSEQDWGSNKGLHTWVSSRSFNKNTKKRREQLLTKHSLINIH